MSESNVVEFDLPSRCIHVVLRSVHNYRTRIKLEISGNNNEGPEAGPSGIHEMRLVHDVTGFRGECLFNGMIDLTAWGNVKAKVTTFYAKWDEMEFEPRRPEIVSSEGHPTTCIQVKMIDVIASFD